MESKKYPKELNPQGFIILIMFNASLHLLHLFKHDAQAKSSFVLLQIKF